MPSPLVFRVATSPPELIRPAEPTPYEFKPLSDIDDQKGLRKQNQFIQFYQKSSQMEGVDPVQVIKRAVAQTLVYYYPFAGRLVERENEKLVVECSGEGVMFIEATADVRLEQFGGVPQPPFAGAEDLLWDPPESRDIVGGPLLVIQVTRMACGGFTFALRLNHTMSDATGIVQFMTAVSELARGASAPSVLPVWNREFLNARNPPQISCQHPVYRELEDTKQASAADMDRMVQRSFFFGAEEIACLRNHVPHYLQSCSRFDVLTTCLWRCRTIALNLDSDEEVGFAFPVNARSKFTPPLPVGYYGNVIGIPVALSTVGQLCQNSLGYALELVRRAKTEVTEEYIRSTADLLSQKGRTRFTTVNTFYVSDLTRMGLKDIDFGWGEAVYGGPIWGGRPASFFVATKNNKGEDGTLVTMDLPKRTMERFAIEIKNMIREPDNVYSSYIECPQQ